MEEAWHSLREREPGYAVMTIDPGMRPSDPCPVKLTDGTVRFSGAGDDFNATLNRTYGPASSRLVGAR